MGAYYVEWAVVLLPLVGAGASFLCETPRRAAHTVLGANLLAFLAAVFVLAIRLIHRHDSVFDSVISFWSTNPQTGKFASAFASDFHPQLGVRVDAFGVAFAAVVLFVAVLAMWHSTVSMHGDVGYRRLFWVSSVLIFGVVGLVLSPNLFQAWFMWEIIGVAALVIALHWWEDGAVAAAARRAFVLLRIADVALLAGVVITFVRLGTDGLNLAPASGESFSDPFDFSVLRQEAARIDSHLISGVGGRTLIVLGVLFVIAGLIRAAQVPMTLWLTDMVDAPLLGFALVTTLVTGSGIFLLAKVWALLLPVTHLLAVVAVIGVVTAVVAAILAVLQREVARFIVWISTAQMGLIVAALGMGGYSPSLEMLFVYIIFNTVLVLAAGHLVRSYRTREIAEMGGAWTKMRTTSILLGIWLVAVAGINLSNYNVISSAWRNVFADQGGTPGHVTRTIQVVVVIGVVLAAIGIAIAGARFWLRVCSGEPSQRRGFATDRIHEAEPRLIRSVVALVVGGGIAILVGIPANIRGWTFNHFIFYGNPATEHPQSLSVVGPAIALSLGVLVIAAGAVWLGRTQLIKQFEWMDRVVRVEHGIESVSARVADFAAQNTGAFLLRVEKGVLDPIVSAGGAAVTVLSSGVERSRTNRIQLQLVATVAVTAAVLIAALLYATGHLGAH